MKSENFPKCPRCGSIDYDIKNEDIIWVRNGHKVRMGYKMVEAVDPVALRGTCSKCGLYVDFAEARKEKVNFD